MPDEASPFLIDPILPKRTIHLLAGPSGAGKSRWLWDTLLEWQEGIPVLDFPSHPVPWCYVAADRSMESVHRSLTSMSIDPTKLSIIPAWEEGLSTNRILDACKPYQFVVWESFGSFVDPPGRGIEVKKFLNSFHRAIRAQGLTVLGIMESPKMKPNDKYENPRQRISGPAGWAHFTETVLVLEFADCKDVSSPERVLHVCPRDSAGLHLNGAFDSKGHLTFIRPPISPLFAHIVAPSKTKN